MMAWASAGPGRQNGHLPPAWKLGLRTKYFWIKLKSVSWFQLIDLILAMTVFLPVWNLHCTRVRFTVVVSCNDELAVHSCPLLCLQRWVAKFASGLFYCWSSLCNNNMATNLQRFTLYYSSRRFVAWDCWMQTSWQVMQQDSDMLIAVSHVHLYFVKSLTSKSIATLQQIKKNPLLVGVWPTCLSVKLHLCRLLFMQYKIAWLVTVEYMYAGLWEYVLTAKV